MIGIADENGNLLDTFPDTSIELRMNNPIFADEEIIPGSFTLPFEIPGGDLSENNAHLLEHPDVPERRGGKLTFKNRTILYDGCPFKKGDLVINPVDSRRYTANFFIGLRSLGNKLKNMRLRELMNEEIVMTEETYSKRAYIKPSAKYWTSTLEFTPSGGKDGAYCIYEDNEGVRLWRTKVVGNINNEPPTNSSFDENDYWENEPFKLKVNGEDYEEIYLDDLAGAINSNGTNLVTASYVASGSSPLGHIVNRYIDMYPTLDPEAFETDFHVEASDDSEAARAMWHVEAADITAYQDAISDFVEQYRVGPPVDDKLRFHTIYNDGLYEDYKKESAVHTKTKQLPLCNLMQSSELVGNDPNAMWNGQGGPFLVRNYNSLLPQVMIQYIFERITEEFGVGFIGDFFDETWYSELCLVHSNVCEHKQHYIGYREFLFFKPSFNIADLVPDWTIEEFLKQLQRKLNLMVYYNDLSNQIVIKSRKPMMLATDYEDITHLSSPYGAIDDVSYTGVRLKSPKDPEDLLAQEDVLDIGDVENEISSDVSGLELTGTVRLTPLNGLGAGSLTNVPRMRVPEFKELPLRLMFESTIIHSGLLLKFPGEDGIYEERYKQYVRFLMNRKEVQFNIAFEFRHLMNLDFEKKYMIDRVKYFIKSVQVRLTQRGVGVARVAMYTA